MSDEIKGGPGRDIIGCAGCCLALAGAVTAVLTWAPLARSSIHGGFEGRHRDLSVLYIDLPLVALGGALVPLGVWALTVRWLRRPWLAAVAAVAAVALGVWGLSNWWTPYEQPEFME
ncbi:hypothetical protein ABZ729_04185 [Streptomyces sp. NPDC006678]|uniref:hypothetical protein n=1 Tax=unclassified Streptomyces TaxID=2593676 RepID=UPI0033A33D56